MAEKVSITSPVGRIVAGSLYKANTTDFDGKPLVVKTGPNAGQPRVNYYIGLAIPKGAETHWAHTEWGKQIWAIGNAAFPAAAQRPDFAWKIEDGDSAIPNKRNKKPCDNEGWKGHWIVRLSSGFAPKVYRPEGSGFVQVMDEDYVKPGYYVQALFSVDGNGNQNNSGVYLNTQMVCFRGYGAEIVFGPSVEEAGFGAAPLPAGASAIPLASSVPPPAVAASATGAPAAALPGATAAVPVVPNLGFLNVPLPTSGGPTLPTTSAPVPAVPAAPLPTAPVSPSSRMTAKAGANSYEAFIAGGWTEAQLIAQGYMNA